MCDGDKANKAGKKKDNKPVNEKEKKCPASGKVEIVSVAITADAPDGKVIMNDPDNKILVKVVVTFKESKAADALDSLPPNISFSFSDPSNDNTKKVASFQYGSKYLGKRDDPSAKFWDAHSDHAATSTDGFKTNAKAALKVLSGCTKAEAKIFFKPSGVGGDDYKVKATLFKSDGTTEAGSDESSKFTVWRSVTFDKIYEMHGVNHVSKNATTAKISPVFNPAFVKYTAGARNEIAAAKSVKYIGLWKDTSTPQESWATIHAKKAGETPTAQEITDAKNTGADAASLAKRTTARNKIIAKAQKWADRIHSKFSTAMNKWTTDAGVPENCLIGIQYYHPKYSHGGGDYATTEWKLGEASVPAWLRIGAFPKSGGGHYYTNIDPDGLWTNWGGLSHGSGRISLPKGNPDATTTQAIRHEAGHATKSYFKRDVFGPSLDHSVSNAGIMYKTTAGGTTFTTREKKILRGIKP
jgi:hypothetical protein